MNYTDLIWDFDGTLFDTYPAMVNALQKAFEDLHVQVSKEDILKRIKVSVADALIFYNTEFNIDTDLLMKNFRKYESTVFLKDFLPFNYIKEICELVVKSGGRNFLITHRDKLAVTLIEENGMGDFFEAYVTMDNGFKRKPDPEAFNYLINKYKLDRNKTLGVGDRELDVLAAQGAGVCTCLYDDKAIAYNCSPDHIISSFEELEKILL